MIRIELRGYWMRCCASVCNLSEEWWGLAMEVLGQGSIDFRLLKTLPSGWRRSTIRMPSNSRRFWKRHSFIQYVGFCHLPWPNMADSSFEWAKYGAFKGGRGESSCGYKPKQLRIQSSDASRLAGFCLMFSGKGRDVFKQINNSRLMLTAVTFMYFSI